LAFFIVAGLIAAFAAAVVLAAAGRAPAENRLAAARSRYRAVVARIAGDREAGLVSDDDAARLEADAGRALLAAADRRPARAGLLLPAAAGGVGLAALGVYALVGAPGTADRPYGARVEEARAAVAGGGAMGLPLSERLLVLKANADDAPDDAAAWTRLGRAYLSFGRTSEAGDAFLRAIEAGGETPARLADLAASLLLDDANRDAERRAADLLARALAEDPRNVPALQLAGFLAIRKGDYENAETALSAALDLAPDSPNAGQIRAALDQARAALDAAAAP